MITSRRKEGIITARNFRELSQQNREGKRLFTGTPRTKRSSPENLRESRETEFVGRDTCGYTTRVVCSGCAWRRGRWRLPWRRRQSLSRGPRSPRWPPRTQLAGIKDVLKVQRSHCGRSASGPHSARLGGELAVRRARGLQRPPNPRVRTYKTGISRAGGEVSCPVLRLGWRLP